MMTGPVAVNGAMPGDELIVDILAVDLATDWGWNLTRTGKGTLPDEFPHERRIHIGIDRQRRVVTMPWGLELNAAPFFGVMGVAPPPTDGPQTSVIPRAWGGNIDCKHLAAGARLHLPVFNEGALFSAGDGHALQGDGEVCLTAIETGLRGTFRLTVAKDTGITSPWAETPTHIIALAFDPRPRHRRAIRRPQHGAADRAPRRPRRRRRLYVMQHRRRRACDADSSTYTKAHMSCWRNRPWEILFEHDLIRKPGPLFGIMLWLTVHDQRHRPAAVRALMLGAARDVNLRMPDQPGQRAADKRARVPRRGNVAVVEHRVAIAAQAAVVAGLGLGRARRPPLPLAGVSWPGVESQAAIAPRAPARCRCRPPSPHDRR